MHPLPPPAPPHVHAGLLCRSKHGDVVRKPDPFVKITLHGELVGKEAKAPTYTTKVARCIAWRTRAGRA